MEPSKNKKPASTRLVTNTPSDRQSTISLPTLAPKIPTEINMQQRAKSERQAIAPFLFPENDRDEENIAPMKQYVPEVKPVYVTHKSVEDDLSPTNTKMKTMYYEDAFAVRGSHNSPKERVAQDSVVVAELNTNHKACSPSQVRLSAHLTLHHRRERKIRDWFPILSRAWPKSTSVQSLLCRWLCITTSQSSLVTPHFPHTF